MRPLFSIVALSIAAAAAPGGAALSVRDDTVAINALIDAFLAAEHAYDPVALAKLIAPDFVEVSPKGEIDAHDRFLGFYAPANRTQSPAIDSSRREVRVVGDTGIAIVTLALTPPGRPQPIEMRATYVARRSGVAWRLAGTHFTAVRP